MDMGKYSLESWHQCTVLRAWLQVAETLVHLIADHPCEPADLVIRKNFKPRNVNGSHVETITRRCGYRLISCQGFLDS